MQEAASQAKLETRDLGGMGVGSPGDADEETGVVSDARNLPNWIDPFPLGENLSDQLGTPVKIGNDVSVAVQAEFELGAAKEFNTVLGVWWGTGVGGGLILDGKQWLGRGAAGEIGHVVVKRGGARCTCGRKGCMEAYAGRLAMEIKARKEVKKGAKTDLFKIMEENERDRLTSGIWERALKHGDDLATILVDRAVKALGVGIASSVNLIDPEAVIIGGGLGCALRREVRPPDRGADASASLRGRSPARDAPCRRSAISAARSAPLCSSRKPDAPARLARMN